MIRRISIHKFKSIESLELDLGQLNVLVGANGAGKSNLLEGIGVLGAAAWGRVDDESLLRRGVRPGVPSLYKMSFRGSRLPLQIQLSADSGSAASSNGATYAVGVWNPTDSPDSVWGYSHERLTEAGRDLVGRSPASREETDRTAGLAALKRAELPADSDAASLLATLRDYCIYTPVSSAMRGLFTDPQARSPVGLSGGRLAEGLRETLAGSSRARRAELEDQLSEMLDWVERVSVTPVEKAALSRSVPAPREVIRFVDRFMAEKRNELTAYDASEGALYVLFALVVCLHPAAPKVCAIDNVDQGLNPRLARALMARIADWILDQPERRLLLTTHNPTTLDGLPLADDRVRLFTVDRSRLGRTEVRRVEITPRILRRAEEGWTLSRLWVSGELGGVPNV